MNDKLKLQGYLCISGSLELIEELSIVHSGLIGNGVLSSITWLVIMKDRGPNNKIRPGLL